MKFHSVFSRLLLIFFAVFLLSELCLFGLMNVLLKDKIVGQTAPSVTLLNYWIIFAALSVAVAVFTFLTVLRIGRRYLRPLKQITAAVRQVADGNYAVSLPKYTYKDEIGVLISCFSVMLKELNATETMRNDFMASVSHEFRTPLTIIAGHAQLLSPKDEAELQHISMIYAETQHLSALCDDMLLLSRLEADDEVPKKQSYRLDEQIRNAIIAQERVWSTKKLEFEIDFSCVSILGNERLLYQVWWNLLSNAIKYAAPGSTIRMLLTQQDETRFTIENTGAPLQAEQLEHIFDKFYQVRPSYSGQGSGFGLAIAKKIVDCHGGTITAESNGNVTRFTVTL